MLEAYSLTAAGQRKSLQVTSRDGPVAARQVSWAALCRCSGGSIVGQAGPWERTGRRLKVQYISCFSVCSFVFLMLDLPDAQRNRPRQAFSQGGANQVAF